MRNYHVLSIVLTALYVLIHLIFIIILWGRYNYDPLHLLGEATEAQEVRLMARLPNGNVTQLGSAEVKIWSQILWLQSPSSEPVCHIILFNDYVGTSLAVQWLGLRASTAGGVGLIPGRGAKISHAVQRGRKKNYSVIYSYEVIYTQLIIALFSKLRTSIKSLRFAHFLLRICNHLKRNLMKFNTINNYLERKLFCNFFENRNYVSV